MTDNMQYDLLNPTSSVPASDELYAVILQNFFMYQNVIQRGKQVEVVHPSVRLHVQDINDVYLLVDRNLWSGVQKLRCLKGVLAVGCALPHELPCPLTALRTLCSRAGNGHVVLLRSWI